MRTREKISGVCATSEEAVRRLLAARRAMPLEELLASYLPNHHTLGWTWDDEERDVSLRVCLCCGGRGHYQEQLEAWIAAHGLGGMSVCLGEDGFVWDGHHRIIAAKHLGISVIPLESRADADARWLRDHGARSWEERLFGDAVASEGCVRSLAAYVTGGRRCGKWRLKLAMQKVVQRWRGS